jgi:hypothetical protein
MLTGDFLQLQYIMLNLRGESLGSMHETSRKVGGILPIILPRLQLVNVQADGRYLSLPVSRQAAICFRDPKIKKKFS